MFSDVDYDRADKARRALLTALIEDELLRDCTNGRANSTAYGSAQDVLNHLGIEGVDALKMADMSVDSLEILNIIVTIEEDLGIDLDDAKIESFMLESATIGSVLPVITAAMGGVS